MSTNEQGVIEVKAKIALHKDEYYEAVKNHLRILDSGNPEEILNSLLEVQKCGNVWFNFCEELVGNSSLLGAHQDAYWAQGFAEDCFAILKVMPQHYELLHLGFKKQGKKVEILPTSTSFANMQRISKKYIKKSEISELIKDFLASFIYLKSSLHFIPMQ